MYGNVGFVTATSADRTVTASDASYHFGAGTDTTLRLQKDVNAADPLHPTAAEDANDASNPRLLLVGSNAVWTYLLTTFSATPLAVGSFTDDAGTPALTSDDFTPKFVSGDSNNNHLLDAGETWLYTSSGVVSYQVHAGLYGNIAKVIATGAGHSSTDSDAGYHFVT